MTELINNGSFSTVSINPTHGWHVPTNWTVEWNASWFDGSLRLESVGAVYNASNALLFKYTPDSEWYDYVENTHFAPGIYQSFTLTNTDVENMESLVFSVKARYLDDAAYNKINVYLYKGYFNETTGKYEIHYDSEFEDYLILRTIEIKSQNWEEYTFSITNTQYFPNGIYILGIAPYISMNGVQNEVIETGVILDDVSLTIEYKEAEEDDEETGIIKNGSFTKWESGVPSNWFILNTDNIEEFSSFNISQSSAYGSESSLLIESGQKGYNTALDESKIAPGVYQFLDFSNYEYGVDLILGFSVKADTKNHLNDINYGHIVCIYIYKATKDYSPIGNTEDYVYCYRVNISDSKWVSSVVSDITLKKGYYFIGITPYVEYSTMGVAARPLFAVVDDFSGDIEAHQPTISYGELAESFGSWLYDADNMTVDISDVSILPDNYGFIDSYHTVKYNSDILIEDIKASNIGLNYTVLSKSESKALLSFTHSTLDSSPRNFKVCIYKTEYHLHSQKYRYTEVISEEIISTNKNGWYSYAKAIDTEYDTYYSVVIYPYCEDGSLFTLNLNNASFVTFNERTYVNTGSYEDPLTSEDGKLLNNIKVDGTFAPVFYVYYSGASPKEYFIKSNGKYYCTSGSVDNYGCLMCYTDKIVQSPCNVSGSRYFFSDGHMAVNEVVEYQGTAYQAGPDGSLTQYIVNIPSLNTNTDSIALDITESQTIEVTFDTKQVDVTLKAETYNASIASITSIESGKSSNKITVYGKSVGGTTLRVSYLNPNGGTVEKLISIEVVDPAGYQNADVHMVYETNVVESEKSLSIDYFITPEYITSLPLEWSSSNEELATVDMYGNVLAKSPYFVDGQMYNSCIITATNPHNGQQASCTIYVRGELFEPSRIEVSSNPLYIAINQTTRITTKVFNEYDRFEDTVQNVQWLSSNTKIATVDRYGHITGITRGVVDIICTSVVNPLVSATISVHVTGTVIEVQDLELSCYEVGFNPLWNNNKITIDHRVIPSNTNDSVVWETSDENVVKVTQSGTVYLNPSFEELYGFAVVTCRSADRANVYKQCNIDIFTSNEKESVITLFDSELTTYVGQTLRIDYDVFYLHTNRGSDRVSVTPSTTNTVTLKEDSGDKYIEFVANESGTFEIELYTTISATDSKKIIINVLGQNTAPQFVENLNVLYALQNDTCILRCKIKDDIDSLDKIQYYIDFGDGNGYEAIFDYYEPHDANLYQYFFITDYQLTPGEIYSAKIKAVDSYGLESESNTVEIVIPEASANKEGLAAAKTDYDKAMDSVLYILEWIIPPEDPVMRNDVKSQFFINYKIYCRNYENLRDMLDQCIAHINSQIESSQAEMSLLSDALSSDGTSVATYSVNDYTNSNYQSITDMDYYQNECIKQLVARVLELEARLNELTNKNN